MVRCKFECVRVTEYSSAYEYELRPVFGDEVNTSVWSATPMGNLTMSVIKNKGKLFEVGKAYFLDLTECPQEVE